MACCPDECEYIDIGSSHYVLFSGFHDIDDNYLNSATGNWYLYDAEDTSEAIASGTMSYLSATDGNYRGTISASVTGELEDQRFYLIRIVLTQSEITVTRELRKQAHIAA